jgi:hypothetical protein
MKAEVETETCGDCLYPFKWVKVVPSNWNDRRYYRDCWCCSQPVRFPELKYTGGGMCCPLCGTTACGGCDA